jgi:F-type H+-transporting ATPase subunit epsilon
MEKTFPLAILTPEKKIFDGPIVSLIVPAELGYLGVLANHAPLIASLKTGRIIIRTTRATTVFENLAKGFLEVGRERTSIVIENIKEN